MDLAIAVRERAEPIVESHGAYVIECLIRGERGTRVVELYIDTDPGITTELCAAISRELASRIDADDIVPGHYRLEVSSPGLDRPLKLHRQYKKNIGRTLKVNFTHGGAAVTITGTLTAVTDSSISIEDEKTGVVELPLGGIHRATVEPRFK
jgi:ribosome maturation factor RimP